MSTLLSELKERGFVFALSSEERLAQSLQKPITLYAGFDATASSFHVGHLMLFMLFRHFQKAGHRIIALLGGGTTQVGDPSDKNAQRPLMSLEDIQSNVDHLKKTFERLLDPHQLIIKNNASWLLDINYVQFLREVGRHVSLNRLLSFDFIKRRIAQEKPISFLEVNYILLQSYDFLHLFQTEKCILQLGGQDQWANIISGIELIHKVMHKEAFGFTLPLLTTASKQKMGKTASGAVWLDAEKLSPYNFWQFWRNVADDDVLRFLKIFTFLPLEEIKALENYQGHELNKAKVLLADHVTEFVHGTAGLQQAHKNTNVLFKGEGRAEECIHLQSLEEPVINVLERIGFVTSRSEARRKIKEGAVRINDEAIQTEALKWRDYKIKNNSLIKLSLGKKKHVLLKLP